MGSKPSTRTPGIPYATAFCAIVSLAICFEIGVEIAHWLFTQKKTVEVLRTDAKFMASWKSPSDVAPSPNHASEEARSLRIFAAQATPTACGRCVAMGTVIGPTRWSRGFQNPWVPP